MDFSNGGSDDVALLHCVVPKVHATVESPGSASRSRFAPMSVPTSIEPKKIRDVLPVKFGWSHDVALKTPRRSRTGASIRRVREWR